MAQSERSPIVAFVGGGNMAQALMGGLIADGWPASAIRVAEPVEALHELLAERGVTVTADNKAAVRDADVVVLAVKPQVMEQVLRELATDLREALVVSIAAGISTASLALWLGQSAAQARVVRAMPNTPALVQLGATGLYAPASLAAPDRALAERILSAAGLVLWLSDEALMHAVTAVSGSGPAYFFFLMEQMVIAGQALGLDEKSARTLTLQTALGAAQMALTSSSPPAKLRQQVTSPNGTTQAAIDSLQADEADRAIVKALQQAAQRSRALAGEVE